MRSHRATSQARIGHRRARDDAGFTLVELIIVVALIPLIAGAIAIALISVLRLQPQVSSRVNHSVDAEIVAANYVRDVQSSSKLTTSSAAQYVACGAGGGKQLLGLQIVGTNGTTTYVSYQEVTLGSGAKATYVLNRLSCVGSPKAKPFVKRIASNLPPPTAQGYATVTCAPTVGCTASSGWMPTAGVASVSLAIAAPGKDGGYEYSLSALPQAWSPASGASFPGGSAIFPFMVVNNGNCASMPTGSTGGWFNVRNGTITSGGGNAPIATTSPCANSITLANPSGSVNASQVYSADCPNPQSVSAPSTIPETCWNVTDPLAGNLTLPTSASPSAPPASACQTSGGNVTCSPGEYATMPNFANGANVTFTPGIYVFDQQFTASGKQTITFQPGTYWFKGGFTGTSQSSTTMDLGTYLFGTPSTPASTVTLNVSSGGPTLNTTNAGALVYLEGGSMNLAGGSASSILGEPQNYNVAIWDAAPNNGGLSTVTIGSGASTTALGGIYVPTGQVVITGNGTIKVPFVITDLGQMTGAATLLVG
jgi:prepilin-type N-terminal cleavage/methylation domain-containing protein